MYKNLNVDLITMSNKVLLPFVGGMIYSIPKEILKLDLKSSDDIINNMDISIFISICIDITLENLKYLIFNAFKEDIQPEDINILEFYLFDDNKDVICNIKCIIHDIKNKKYDLILGENLETCGYSARFRLELLESICED